MQNIDQEGIRRKKKSSISVSSWGWTQPPAFWTFNPLSLLDFPLSSYRSVLTCANLVSYIVQPTLSPRMQMNPYGKQSHF
jgi:hypothetical protein